MVRVVTAEVSGMFNIVCKTKDYINSKTVHSYNYEWEKVQWAIWWDSPRLLNEEPIVIGKVTASLQQLCVRSHKRVGLHVHWLV